VLEADRLAARQMLRRGGCLRRQGQGGAAPHAGRRLGIWHTALPW